MGFMYKISNRLETSSFWNKFRYSMDIINLRNNVWGKTANGKTLCALLVFISTLVERPASSRADEI